MKELLRSSRIYVDTSQKSFPFSLQTPAEDCDHLSIGLSRAVGVVYRQNRQRSNRLPLRTSHRDDSRECVRMSCCAWRRVRWTS